MKLIFNPDRFFSELEKEDAKLRRPAGISLTLAFTISIYQYILISRLSQMFPSEVIKFFIIGAFIGIFTSFIGVFALWMILALIMYGLSEIFGGKGSFRKTFEFTGYGFLPSLIGSIITVPLSIYYVWRAEVSKINIAQLQTSDGIKTIILTFIPQNLIYANLILSFAVTLWSLTLWTFAVKHARNLPTKKAFVSALIPTVIFALYQFYSVANLL